MATDDDAAAKAPITPAPASEPKEASERKDTDRLNERLTERIRHGTYPPPEPREVREAPREVREAPREVREPSEARETRAPSETRAPRERDPREDKLNETIRQRLEHLVPELVKKTFAAGMGAVFSTEEGIRKIAREVSLPDVVGYVASSADGAKDKVFEIVARETRDFLANLNLTEEIAKILTTLSFEIKTEIRFIPNSERITGAEPDVKASVKLKRNDKAMGNEEGEPRESRSRLRFWRRDEESAESRDSRDGNGNGDDDGGHDR